MFGKVLLATDLTDEADSLSHCLFSLCPEIDTEVMVAHVFDNEADAQEDSNEFRKVQSRLNGLVGNLCKEGYEAVRAVYRSGQPFEELKTIADDENADLIMVASHGKGFFKAAILGSTTLDLARATQRPLFVSKTAYDEAGADDGLLQRVVLPTDFSLKSLSALNFIKHLREHVSDVIFTHVIERSRNQDDLDEKKATAGRDLQELVEEMARFGIKATYKIRKGIASKEIIRLAEEEKASLIVMAKTGAGLVQDLIMGSTAQNIILNSEISVLLLPPDDILDE